MSNHLRNLVLALDRFVNVLLLFGSSEQTVSIHAALAKRDGKVWGCVLCRWLSWTIENDHCDKALENTDTSAAAGLRALFQLIVVSALVYYSPAIIHRVF